MKSLKISHLFLISVLFLGLFVAWSAATPSEITGEQIVAGCDCSGTTQYYCKDVPGNPPDCSDRYRTCNTGGDLICTANGPKCIAGTCTVSRWSYRCTN